MARQMLWLCRFLPPWVGVCGRVWTLCSGFNIKNKLIHSCVHEKATTATGMIFRSRSFPHCGFPRKPLNRSNRAHIFSFEALMTLPIIFANKNQYSNVRGQHTSDAFDVFIALTACACSRNNCC